VAALEVVNYESPDAWTRRVLFNMALNERRRWGREQPIGRTDRVIEGATPSTMDELRNLTVEVDKILDF